LVFDIEDNPNQMMKKITSTIQIYAKEIGKK
jgi:hypothetical protein